MYGSMGYEEMSEHLPAVERFTKEFTLSEIEVKKIHTQTEIKSTIMNNKTQTENCLSIRYTFI